MTRAQYMTEEQYEDLLNAAAARVLETPSIYDIEAFLQKLERKHKVEAWALRHYLKWFFKACYKYYDLDMKNPYWMSKRARHR